VPTLKFTTLKVQLLPENAAYADQLVKEMQLRNYSPGNIKTYSNLLSKLAEYFSLLKILQVDILGRE